MILWVSYNTLAFLVRLLPLPIMGTVSKGTVKVWQIPTLGIPVLNPTYNKHEVSVTSHTPIQWVVRLKNDPCACRMTTRQTIHTHREWPACPENDPHTQTTICTPRQQSADPDNKIHMPRQWSTHGGWLVCLDEDLCKSREERVEQKGEAEMSACHHQVAPFLFFCFLPVPTPHSMHLQASSKGCLVTHPQSFRTPLFSFHFPPLHPKNQGHFRPCNASHNQRVTIQFYNSIHIHTSVTRYDGRKKQAQCMVCPHGWPWLRLQQPEQQQQRLDQDQDQQQRWVELAGRKGQVVGRWWWEASETRVETIPSCLYISLEGPPLFLSSATLQWGVFSLTLHGWPWSTTHPNFRASPFLFLFSTTPHCKPCSNSSMTTSSWGCCVRLLSESSWGCIVSYPAGSEFVLWIVRYATYLTITLTMIMFFFMIIPKLTEPIIQMPFQPDIWLSNLQGMPHPTSYALLRIMMIPLGKSVCKMASFWMVHHSCFISQTVTHRLDCSKACVTFSRNASPMEQTYQIPQNCWLNATSSNVCLAWKNAVAIGFFSINQTLLHRSPNLRSSVSHVDTE